MKNIGIIGGGIIGLAIAHKLSLLRSSLHITIFEKENNLGQHQSTHNSGVLHAGLYYRPGSAKAKLAVSGLRQMLDFCRNNDVAHEQCGKLVVAADQDEAFRLRKLFERGLANGLHGLCKVAAKDIPSYEPHARGVAALHVPEEGIVDYAAVIEVLTHKVTGRGHTILTGWNVSKITRNNNAWILRSRTSEKHCDFIVNTAGLHCDRVSQMAGERPQTPIIPFRGLYYKLRKDRQYLVRNLIYPVPDLNFPFLGVHFTRLIHGGVEAGPNATLALAREGYSRKNINLRDAASIICFPGLWRFMLRHKGMCLRELSMSLSRARFARALQRLVPEVREEDLERGGCGVRAQAMEMDGSLVEDFKFIQQPAAMHVLNAPSPAATASLAIADEIVSRMSIAN